VTDPKQIPLEPANELEGVMVQVAAGTRDERAFLTRLWDSELLVPQEGPPSEELRELPAEPGAEVGLPILPAHGRRTVPVYSSEAQMRKRAPYEWSSFLRLGTPALQQMLAGSDACLFINPGGDLSTMLDPLQIAALPERHPPAERIPGDAPLRVGAAAAEPGLESVTAFLGGQPQVRAAFAARVEAEEGDAPGGRLVVGLLLDPGASGPRVLSAASEALGGQVQVSMLVIDEHDPGTIGGWMLTEGRPFYER
jgi:SseB protein N-terminal domain/SseB protein C-terminal domain